MREGPMAGGNALHRAALLETESGKQILSHRTEPERMSHPSSRPAAKSACSAAKR